MAPDRTVALVTGASGIAAETAALLVRAGLAVTVVDISRANLDAFQVDCPVANLLEHDLTDPSAAEAIVGKMLAQFGRLDVLVNVVGISGRRFGDGPVDRCTDEGWQTVMDTNVTTTFRMCRAALQPMLAAGGGSIVNTASVLGYAPASLFATHAYAASKGAIIALTRAMASYYADQHIRVNAVAPGLIATPMSLRAQSDEATKAFVKHRQPLTGDFGAALDVAEAIRFLALDSSKFITGTVLEVAGGWGVA